VTDRLFPKSYSGEKDEYTEAILAVDSEALSPATGLQ